MIVIDSNSLVVLLLGRIDPHQINNHKRTSLYDDSDYDILIRLIKDFKNVKLIPNVLTEADNLLNEMTGDLKEEYLIQLTDLMSKVDEEYIKSIEATNDYAFRDLGLTDTLVLLVAEKCDLLITSDSKLADQARSRNIQVFDLVKQKNERLKK